MASSIEGLPRPDTKYHDPKVSGGSPSGDITMPAVNSVITATKGSAGADSLTRPGGPQEIR